MVAKEQESNDQLQDFIDNEAEETLSLCDLVDSSSNGNNSDSSSSKEEYQFASHDDQDFFEFFSEDFAAASSTPKDNIIFCGKLIPYKQPAAAAVHPEQTQKQIKKNLIFPWKSSSFKLSRTTSSIAKQQDKSSYKYKALSQRKGFQKYGHDEYDFSVKEVSAKLAATSVKPRWYLLAFGHGRFIPSEMKLTDLKHRQSRRIPARMFRSDGVGEKVKKRSEKRSPWKGFWALLKVFGRKSQQSNAAVKASFDCIRHV